MLTVSPRFINGVQTSNEYKLNTDYMGVWVGVNKLSLASSELEIHHPTTRDATPPNEPIHHPTTRDAHPPTARDTEVLTNEVLKKEEGVVAIATRLPENENSQPVEEKKRVEQKVSIPPPAPPAAPVAIPENLNTPEFVEAWKVLVSTKKWKRKDPSSLNTSLKMLARYDVAFATMLCELATAAGNQGVVFGDTPEKYEKWKSAKTGAATDRRQQPQQAVGGLPANIKVY